MPRHEVGSKSLPPSYYSQQKEYKERVGDGQRRQEEAKLPPTVPPPPGRPTGVSGAQREIFPPSRNSNPPAQEEVDSSTQVKSPEMAALLEQMKAMMGEQTRQTRVLEEYQQETRRLSLQVKQGLGRDSAPGSVRESGP